MDKQQTQYRLTPKLKWKMLTNYWKFQNRSVQTFGYVYEETNGLNHGPIWKTHFGRTIMESNLRKSYWNMAGRKFQIGDVSLFIVKKDYTFLSVYVDDVKLAGKKHNLDPMWKALNKEVDLGEPTSFLDHVYLGCTQRQCEVSQRNCG